MTLSISTEDYLKSIYQITIRDNRASTSQIAETLEIAPASVTGMLKKMAQNQPPLVDYKKHHGVKLTPQGRTKALEIVRRHRLLEMYLHQVLEYDWDQVHREADQLEHVISDDFEERIAKALGDPSWDPHGDPIPSRELELPERDFMALVDLRPGQTAIIRRVADEDPDLLRHLSNTGILPGTRIEILEFSRFDENITFRIKESGSKVTLGPKITHKIYVELLHSER